MKRLLIPAMVAAISPFAAAPALAWSPAGCNENPLPPWATTPTGKAYCRGVKAGGGNSNSNSNTNNNHNHQGQQQKQQQGQEQAAIAALNARLSQANQQTASVSEVQQQFVGPVNSSGGCDRATIFANIAPQQDVYGRTHYYPYGGVTVPLGRRSATCDYIAPREAPAPAPVVNVNVPPAPTAAPVAYVPPPEPAAPTIVYVQQRPKCRRISDHDARAIAGDLRHAKRTYDAARVQRDLDALYAACRGTQAAKAVDGP